MKPLSPPSAKSMILPLLSALLLSGSAFAAPPPGAAANGGALYSQNCSSCHGPAGKGDGPTAKDLKSKPPDLTKSKASQQRIETIVRDGLQTCPSWKASLRNDEISALATYTKSLQK